MCHNIVHKVTDKEHTLKTNYFNQESTIQEKSSAFASTEVESFTKNGLQVSYVGRESIVQRSIHLYMTEYAFKTFHWLLFSIVTLAIKKHFSYIFTNLFPTVPSRPLPVI